MLNTGPSAKMTTQRQGPNSMQILQKEVGFWPSLSISGFAPRTFHKTRCLGRGLCNRNHWGGHCHELFLELRKAQGSTHKPYSLLQHLTWQPYSLTLCFVRLWLCLICLHIFIEQLGVLLHRSFFLSLDRASLTSPGTPTMVFLQTCERYRHVKNLSLQSS